MAEYFGNAITPDLIKRINAIEAQRLARTGTALRPEDWQGIVETGLASDVQRRQIGREYELKSRALDIGETQFDVKTQLEKEALEREEKAATISGIGTAITAGKTVYDMLTGNGGGGVGTGLAGAGGVGKLLGLGTKSALEGSMQVAAPLGGQALTGLGAGATTAELGASVASSSLSGMTSAAGIGALPAVGAALPAFSTAGAATSELAMYGTGQTLATAAPAVAESGAAVFGTTFASVAAPLIWAAGAAYILYTGLTGHKRGIQRAEESWFQSYADPSEMTVGKSIEKLEAIDPRLGAIARDWATQSGWNDDDIAITGSQTPADGYGYLAQTGRRVVDMEQSPYWDGAGLGRAVSMIQAGYDPFTPGQEEEWQAMMQDETDRQYGYGKYAPSF